MSAFVAPDKCRVPQKLKFSPEKMKFSPEMMKLALDNAPVGKRALNK